MTTTETPAVRQPTVTATATATPHQPPARIRDGVRSATRKVNLRVVEDQVDAVFCAFLAWMWTYEKVRMQLLPEDQCGIDDEGLDQVYIVTPAIR